jgi:ABC-2 type transport system permease protein
MKSFAHLAATNLKLYLREPITVFFTLGFPIMLVLIFGAIYGNDPIDLFGGYGSMDVYMPGYTALILGSVGLLTVAINTSSYRESGILRRFRATPLRPVIYIAADVTGNLVMMLIGMVPLLLGGWLIYDVRFEGQPLNVLLAVLLGGLAMFSVGYLIASLAPSARAAQVIGMAIFPVRGRHAAGDLAGYHPAHLGLLAADLRRQAIARPVVRRDVGATPAGDGCLIGHPRHLHRCGCPFLSLGVTRAGQIWQCASAGRSRSPAAHRTTRGRGRASRRPGRRRGPRPATPPWRGGNSRCAAPRARSPRPKRLGVFGAG